MKTLKTIFRTTCFLRSMCLGMLLIFGNISYGQSCELTGVTVGTPVCVTDNLTYTLTVNWTGGPDASVSITDGTATSSTGNAPAVDANGSITFTYPNDVLYNIVVTDTESNCIFGPFIGGSLGTITITPSFGQAPYTYGWEDDSGNPLPLPDPCTDRNWAEFGPLNGTGANPVTGGDNSIVEDAINSQPYVIQGAIMTVNNAVFNGGAIINEEIIDNSQFSSLIALRTGVEHDQITGGVVGANMIRTITFSQPVCDLSMFFIDMDNNDVAIINPKLNGVPYAMTPGVDFSLLGANVNFVGGNQFESAADIPLNNTLDGAIEFTFFQCIDEIEIIFYDDLAGPGVFASIGGSYSIYFPPACDYTETLTLPVGCYNITVFDTNGDSEVSTECVEGGVPTCPACTLVLEPETITCDAETAGVDTYTVSIPFDNGTEGFPGGMNYTVTTSGTLGGDNPMIVQSGTITITFTEGSSYDYSIQGTAGNANELCNFTIMGNSPVCEPVVCEDEIAGMVVADASCDLTGITVTITDAAGTIITTLTTDATGLYDSTPAVFPCGNYFAELTTDVPACYGDGGTGPKAFVIDGDTSMNDTDGVNFGMIAEIPTVGEWGLIILALLMSIVAVVGIRERKASEVSA